jgi:hypothetical protein
MADSIVVTPANSPYVIEGTQTYNSISLQDGGFLEINTEAQLTVQSLEKTAQGKVATDAINPLPPSGFFGERQ